MQRLLLMFILVLGCARGYERKKGEHCRRCRSESYGQIDTSESDHPSVFRDLTSHEIKGLLHYLYHESGLNLTIATEAKVNTNYIFSAEVFLPPKKMVLRYLDGKGKCPRREARVMIYRGGNPDPDVIEIVVWPLPKPRYYRHVPYRPRSLPFVDRPPSIKEDITPIIHLLDKHLGDMFLDVFDAQLFNCSDRCLFFNFYNQITPVLSGVRKRQNFYWLQHDSDYNLLRQLDFAVLVKFEVEVPHLMKIWFNGELFDSIEEVQLYYEMFGSSIEKVQFPTSDKKGLRQMRATGKPQFSKPLKDPIQVSPDGKRYSIHDRHVAYGYWQMDIGNVPFNGARLFDIRYRGERIAYEISIQELANFYFGYKPSEYSAYFLDNSFLGGIQSRYLVPGIDCPSDATFLSSTFKTESQDEPVVNAHALCVFELNTYLPLRRHHAYFDYVHQFYEGVENIVLVVRTIPTFTLYDYIIDFIFYNNGAVEVKITPCGAVGTSWYGKKNPFGFQLQKNLMGPLHQHLLNIKADLDIKGTRNRFETLNIEQEVTENKLHIDPEAKITQSKFVRRLMETEREGGYKFNFDTPKYLTIVNKKVKDEFGNRAGYRIINQAMTNMNRPPFEGNNPSTAWAQYQVAVTKYKDSEPSSSNMYVHSDQPVFTFEDFISDNENIVDQDLVAWITTGMYHIPQKEDLPVTHTTGMSRSVWFVPFNYFEKSPGMSVANSVRIDKKEVNGEVVSVNIRRYGTKSEVTCIPKKNPFEEFLRQNPCPIVQCT